MKGKKLLAAFLLSVILCFMSVLGYGEVRKEWTETTVPYIDFRLLMARVNYMMGNPTIFLDVTLFYDTDGVFGKKRFFPEGIDTEGKIVVLVADNRDVFFLIKGKALSGKFKEELEIIYSFIDDIATDMDTDIVAIFYSKETIPLGYFHQGKYHLWGE